MGESPPTGLAGAVGHFGPGFVSTRDGLKDTADLLQVIEVARFGPAHGLIQPAYRCRLQARLRGIVRRVDHFYFHLQRILAALDPAFPLLAPWLPISISQVDSRQ